MDVKFTIPNPLPALSYTFPVIGGFTGGCIGLIGGAILYIYSIREKKSESQLINAHNTNVAGAVLEGTANFFFASIGYCFSALPYLLGGSFGGAVIGIIGGTFLTKKIGS